jgi:hypothetical protein
MNIKLPINVLNLRCVSPIGCSYFVKIIQASNICKVSGERAWHIEGDSCLHWPVHGSAFDGSHCTTCCEADMNFANESVCLLADNVQNVVTIHRSQEVLQSFYK